MKVLRFTAAWCAPCKVLAAVIETSVFSKFVDVIDVDTVSGKGFAETYRVRSIPTMIVLDDNGNAIRQHTGTLSKETFEKWVEL